jgi:hypothetical protein
LDREVLKTLLSAARTGAIGGVVLGLLIGLYLWSYASADTLLLLSKCIGLLGIVGSVVGVAAAVACQGPGCNDIIGEHLPGIVGGLLGGLLVPLVVHLLLLPPVVGMPFRFLRAVVVVGVVFGVLVGWRVSKD